MSIITETKNLLLEKYNAENYEKSIQVKIQGITPFLFCNPEFALNQTAGISTNRLTSLEEAEKSLYWTHDKSSLMIPAICIKKCISAAGNPYKKGKMSLGKRFLEVGDVQPIEVPFNTVNWELDTRRACPPGASKGGSKPSILRSRGKLMDPWFLEFILKYDTRYLEPALMDDQFMKIIIDAGKLQGLGAFAPRHKGGPFGKFILIEYNV